MVVRCVGTQHANVRVDGFELVAPAGGLQCLGSGVRALGSLLLGGCL